MSGATRHRRVVTGLNEDGRSCILIDGPIPQTQALGGMAWHTPDMPADNSGTEDQVPDEFSFELMHGPGSLFFVNEYPPGMGQGKPDAPMWHATDTIDYIVMLEGEIVFMTETGEVTLRKGDFMVDRGINHAWRNDTDKVAVAAIVILPAHPLGKGRTV